MIYVIIPVYNRKNLTRKCLYSLRNQKNKNFEVVVVDDGSTDGTPEMVKSDFPEVMILKGDGNLWWTGAINKGISYALSICENRDHLLCLNDDLVVNENYIDNFYKLINKHTHTLIQSVNVTKNDDGEHIITESGRKTNWLTAKHKWFNLGKRLSDFNEDYYIESSVLTGRGILIPVEVFKEIGLYNRKHYLQCGDTELPRRANKLKGYNLIVSYDVPVFSYPDAISVNQRDRYTISDIKKYFSDIKSNFNLRYRFWFAYDTTSNIIQGTAYFLFDLMRITVHFFRKLEISSEK